MRTLCILLAFVIACGGGGGDKSTAPTPPPENVQAKAPPPPAKSMDERANEMMDEMVAVFVDANTDCEKLAAGLDAFLDKHSADLKEMKRYEDSLTPEKKQAWETKAKSATEKMMPAMQACATNEKVQATMKRFAETAT